MNIRGRLVRMEKQAASSPQVQGEQAGLLCEQIEAYTALYLAEAESGTVAAPAPFAEAFEHAAARECEGSRDDG